MKKFLFIFAAVLLSSIGLHAGNTITYTASEKLQKIDGSLNPGATTFGPAITNHEFSNGTGTITCAGEITAIGVSAFDGCSSLTSINIPSSVTRIGNYAFRNCSNLISVTVSWLDAKSIFPLSSNTFDGIAYHAGHQGATLYVPAGTMDLYKQATVWKDFGSIVERNKIITYTASERLNGFYSTLNIGATTFGPAITNHEFSNGMGTIICNGPITTIGDNAFLFCSGLTSIDIPASVTSIGADAFLSCTRLSQITIPNSVTTIGDKAFYSCNSLKSINIPNSVTSLGGGVFYQCLSLESVTMPNSITSIKSSAFYGCSKLSQITIPNSVREIEDRAFYGCNSLKSIDIPDSVTVMNSSIFFECSSLESVIIGNSVTSIGVFCFSGCTSLKTVYVYAPNPPSLTEDVFRYVPQDISVYVFDVEKYRERWGTQLSSSCFKQISPEIDGIKYEFFVSNGYKARVVAKEGGYTQSSIIIPEQVTYQDRTFTVTEIGHDAFMNCSALTSIIIPNTVTDIVHGAFQKCSELISIEIPDSVTRIGNGAFDGCSKLSSINIPNSVREIGDGAFHECDSLKSITIPVSVNKIGIGAFKNCTNLDSLEFAKRESTNPINIDTYAFENTALTSVVIPDWMKEIPKGLFYKNSQLKAIYLPISVENINYQSFGECKNLKYIFSVSQTPPVLAEGAFEGHDKDANVIVYVPSQDAKVAYLQSNWSKYFNNFVTDIEYRIISTSDRTAEVVSAIPFEGKVSIPGTTILDGTYYNVIGIREIAFKNDTSLRSISLPSTLQYIGNGAFNGCSKLKDINIKYIEDLQAIGYWAFYKCTALDSVVIPEGVRYLGANAFCYCSSLTYVSLPTGLKNIPEYCFYNCRLRTIIVPEGVDTIGKEAFYDNPSLQTVYLPSTLNEIQTNVFKYCKAITEIVCLAQRPPTLRDGVFTNTDTAIVYVPNRDVLKIYRDSSTWKDYKFKFDDLMAKTNKDYLYEVAGSNEKAQGIAQQYCDSINRATTAKQVEFFTNKALALIDPYTLNDYKGRLADTLDSIANTCPDSAAKPIALGIAAEYRDKIMSAIFRQDAEKIFAEGLAKINEVFELVELKKTYCNNLKQSAKGLDKEIETIAEDFCEQINNAITKEEVNKIYKEGSQVIAMYTYIQFYWSGSPDKGCQTTKGYYDKEDK